MHSQRHCFGKTPKLYQAFHLLLYPRSDSASDNRTKQNEKYRCLTFHCCTSRATLCWDAHKNKVTKNRAELYVRCDGTFPVFLFLTISVSYLKSDVISLAEANFPLASTRSRMEDDEEDDAPGRHAAPTSTKTDFKTVDCLRRGATSGDDFVSRRVGGAIFFIFF